MRWISYPHEECSFRYWASFSGGASHYRYDLVSPLLVFFFGGGRIGNL